jgi:predicted nucleic acid-binding protein
MKTAIDSSVLLAVFTGEPEGRSWLERLMQARREGQLVICDVVYAELAPVFATAMIVLPSIRGIPDLTLTTQDSDLQLVTYYH